MIKKFLREDFFFPETIRSLARVKEIFGGWRRYFLISQTPRVCRVGQRCLRSNRRLFDLKHLGLWVVVFSTSKTPLSVGWKMFEFERSTVRPQTGSGSVEVFQALKRHFRLHQLACKNFAKCEDSYILVGWKILWSSSNSNRRTVRTQTTLGWVGKSFKTSNFPPYSKEGSHIPDINRQHPQLPAFIIEYN